MLSHQRQNQRQFAIMSPQQGLSNSATIPATSTFQEPPRARSHSPHDNSLAPMSYTYISPTQGRKRSAGDAFRIEEADNTEQVAKSMRIPQRRGYVHLPGAVQQHQQAPGSIVNRAASLTRSARPISESGRRGSTPGFTQSHSHSRSQDESVDYAHLPQQYVPEPALNGQMPSYPMPTVAQVLNPYDAPQASHYPEVCKPSR